MVSSNCRWLLYYYEADIGSHICLSHLVLVIDGLKMASCVMTIQGRA